MILRTEFGDRLPEVRGDRVQLQQVVLNLILNAADAMKEIDRSAPQSAAGHGTRDRRSREALGARLRHRHRSAQRRPAVRSGSTPPRRTAWAWASRSAARLSKATRAGSGPRRTKGRARPSRSPIPCLMPPRSPHFDNDVGMEQRSDRRAACREALRRRGGPPLALTLAGTPARQSRSS